MESRGNMLYSSAQAQMAQLSLRRFKRELENYTEELSRIMGEKYNEPFSVSYNFEDLTQEYSYQQLRELSSNYPDLAIYEKKIAEAEEKLAWGYYDALPSIKANGSFTYSGTREFPQNRSWSLGLSASLALFSGGPFYYHYNVSSLKSSVRIAVARLNEARLSYGQTVGASTVLFAMSDSLIAVASVDESDIGKVKNRQKAEIKLDAYPDKTVKGEVFQILDEGKNSNNVIIYKVKIRPYFVPDFFKSQMTANIKIEVSSNRKALLAPSQAIFYSPQATTYVITGFDPKKNPVKKEVKIGVEYEDKTEIISVLAASDLVYIEKKDYRPQVVKDNSSSPLMPKRPTSMVRKAMRNAK